MAAHGFDESFVLEWVVDFFPQSIQSEFEKEIQNIKHEILECCLLAKKYTKKVPRLDSNFELIPMLHDDSILAKEYACWKISIGYDSFKQLFDVTLENDESDEVEVWAWIRFKHFKSKNQEESIDDRNRLLKALSGSCASFVDIGKALLKARAAGASLEKYAEAWKWTKVK